MSNIGNLHEHRTRQNDKEAEKQTLELFLVYLSSFFLHVILGSQD